MTCRLPLLTLLVLVVGGLAACTLLPAPPAEPKLAVLEKPPADIPRAASPQGILLVAVPEAAPAYDTTRMAYSDKKYELGYFTTYEWAEKPTQMIHGLLTTTLRSTHRFHQVIEPPNFSAYDFVLESRLLALTQDYTAEPPMLRAAMRIRLIETQGQQVLGVRDIAAEEPINGEGPHGGVVAANEAVARLVREAVLFALRNAVAGGRGGDRAAACVAGCHRRAGNGA